MITRSLRKSRLAEGYATGKFSGSTWYGTKSTKESAKKKFPDQSPFNDGYANDSTWGLCYNNLRAQVWQPDLANSRICVFFQLEWVLVLIEDFNCNPKNIVFFSDHPTKTKLASGYGAIVINSDGPDDKVAEGKLLQMEKFKYVLKNAPWDSGIKTNLKLPYESYGTGYCSFSYLGHEILEQDGICVDVMPTNFMCMVSASSWRKWILSNFEILNISIWDNTDGKVFEGVTMSDVVTMVSRKKANPNNTSVEWVSYSGDPFTVDLTAYDFWPIYKNAMSVAIFNNVMQHKTGNLPAFNGGSDLKQVIPTLPNFISGNLSKLGARQNPDPRANNKFQKAIMPAIKAPMWLGFSSKQEMDFQYDWMGTTHYAYALSMVQSTPLNQPYLFSLLGEHNFQDTDFNKTFSVTPRQDEEIVRWHKSIK